MAYTAPAVVIDNGSYTTKAGFALDDLPSLVFNSNYIVDNVTNDVIVGDDEMDNYSQSAVSTLLEDGLIYNFDNIVHNWRYVYNNIDNHNLINSNEFPLAMTEQSWNTMKAKVKRVKLCLKNLKFHCLVLSKPIESIIPMRKINWFGY